MESLFVYDEKYANLLKMPEAMLPPESLYRFKPKCKLFRYPVVEGDIFSGSDRLIFGGGVRYLSEEIAALQAFFKYLKEKKLKFVRDV